MNVFAILVLFLSAAVIVGAVLFGVWAAQYFARRAFRHVTRRHLYVPIEAAVVSILPHRRQATVYVGYEFRGKRYENRFLASFAVARLAEQSKRITLLIDPDNPFDVVVEPKFEQQAGKAPKPPSREPSWQEYGWACGVLLALGLRWLPKESLGGYAVTLSLAIGAVLVSLAAWRLFADSRSTATGQAPTGDSAANDQDGASGG